MLPGSESEEARSQLNLDCGSCIRIDQSGLANSQPSPNGSPSLHCRSSLHNVTTQYTQKRRQKMQKKEVFPLDKSGIRTHALSD